MHCFLFWFWDTTSQIGLHTLFSYLSPSQDWVSWGLLVIPTLFIVYPETQLRADSYLVSDKSFFDYWINPSFLLFQSAIACCSSWVSSRQDCITKYRMGFVYSGVSTLFLYLHLCTKPTILIDQKDHMQLFSFEAPYDHWGELLSNFSAQIRHITYLVSLNWADRRCVSGFYKFIPNASSEILFLLAPNWIIIKNIQCLPCVRHYAKTYA